MNKEFLLYEEALALKELGFEEDCFGCYTKDKELSLDFSTNKGEGHWFQLCSAPLYQQAFRWFRENYDLRTSFPSKSPMYFDYVISTSNIIFKDDVFETDKIYIRQEEAELACLRKLIEIVKNKKS